MTRTGYNSSCNFEFLLSPSSSFILYHRHYFLFIQDISRHTGTVNYIEHNNNSNNHHDDDDDDSSSRSKRRSSFSVDSKHNIIDNNHDDRDNNDSDNSKKEIIDDN